MPELTTEQKKELKLWERRMRLAGATSGMIFLMFLVFGGMVQDVSAVTYLYLLLIAAAILWGAHVRMAERCPSCGSRIGDWFGLQAYFGLPQGCKQCGVSFH